ncbi:hypothetical protein Tco_0724556 [Tanacetum coccineum]
MLLVSSPPTGGGLHQSPFPHPSDRQARKYITAISSESPQPYEVTKQLALKREFSSSLRFRAQHHEWTCWNNSSVMSSASSAVTYTSVYTDSEPGRVFWGADEEISDGGVPRVIVLGYDGLPMQPVDPASPDYVPGPEHPASPDYVPGLKHTTDHH